MWTNIDNMKKLFLFYINEGNWRAVFLQWIRSRAHIWITKLFSLPGNNPILNTTSRANRCQLFQIVPSYFHTTSFTYQRIKLINKVLSNLRQVRLTAPNKRSINTQLRANLHACESNLPTNWREIELFNGINEWCDWLAGLNKWPACYWTIETTGKNRTASFKRSFRLIRFKSTRENPPSQSTVNRFQEEGL